MEIAYEAVASGGIVHIISDPNKELFELLGGWICNTCIITCRVQQEIIGRGVRHLQDTS